jgi:arylsulfatase A-like enzyme/Tfp pilus assembly protein PilF
VISNALNRWLALAALVVAPPAWAGEAAERAPASVVLITLDTTRADRLGCYGAERAATPHLDSLARAGVRFDEAISPTPLTLPSHASLMTGMVPRRHGVRNNALFRLGDEPVVLADVLRRNGYRTAAFVSAAVLDRITGIDRGFDVYDDSVRVGPREAFNYEERAASQTTDAVLGHLGDLSEPFFLWVHYFDPHLPYVPPEPFRGRFPDRPYDGEIAFMDDQIGRLLDAVRARSGSLLVVVAGDHGESLGEHGEDAHGIFIYQATQRVPLIVAGPGVPRGKTIDQRVGLVDVAPTVLDLLGLPPLPDVDGRSFAPVLRGETLDTSVYELESFFPTYAYGWSPLRGLVRDDHKYIDAPRTELYRLPADPNEKRNLLPDEDERASSMAEELEAVVEGDTGTPPVVDAELEEQKRRLESLGYVGGTTASAPSTIDPKDGIAWLADLEAGRRAYQTGDPSEGIEPLERLLSNNPRNVPALLALGLCYLGSGKPEMAVTQDRRALEIDPDDPLVHFNLANASAALGETKPEALLQARRHYEKALELNPRFADAYLNYAAFLERGDENVDALAWLRRARDAGVEDPDVETRIAVLHLKKGEVEPAKEAFRRALELHPRAAGPLEAMARITYRQGHWAESAGYFERLLEVLPTPGAAATLASLRLEHLGDREGARKAYERALELTGPDDPNRSLILKRIEELSPAE